MNQFIDENCNSSFSNSFLKMNQFICLSQINPNELNANSFMNGNGPCTTRDPVFLWNGAKEGAHFDRFGLRREGMVLWTVAVTAAGDATAATTSP